MEAYYSFIDPKGMKGCVVCMSYVKSASKQLLW